MTIVLEPDVTIFDEKLSKVIRVSSEGISPKDIEVISNWLPQMLSGEIDTVTIIPVDGVEVDEDLNLVVVAQLDKILEELSQRNYLAIIGKGSVTTGLHVDATSGVDGEHVIESGIRINFNSGQHKDSNVPEYVDTKDFDPHFLFGRSREYKPLSKGDPLVQSYGDFEVSAVVNMAQPVWNVFRNIGDPLSASPPVVHSVIPRKLVVQVLDPEAEISELNKVSTTGYEQTLNLAGSEITIPSAWASPYNDANGKALGPERDVRALDYMDQGAPIDWGTDL